MSQDKPTPDEVAALLNGLQKEPQGQKRQPTSLEIACGGQLMLVQTPAILTLKDKNEDGEYVRFHVTDLQAWGYTPFGILAVGSFDPAAEEDDWESRLFAADVVHNIQFDKERYEAIIEGIKAEEAVSTEDVDAAAQAEYDAIPEPEGAAV